MLGIFVHSEFLGSGTYLKDFPRNAQSWGSTKVIKGEAVLKLPCGDVAWTWWKQAQELLLLKEIVPFPHLFSAFAPKSTDSPQFLKLTACINPKFLKETFSYHVLSDLITAQNIGIGIYPEFWNSRSSAFHFDFKVLGLCLWFI